MWYGTSNSYIVRPGSEYAKLELQRCSGALNEYIAVVDYIFEADDNSEGYVLLFVYCLHSRSDLLACGIILLDNFTVKLNK